MYDFMMVFEFPLCDGLALYYCLLFVEHGSKTNSSLGTIKCIGLLNLKNESYTDLE